MIKNLWRRWKMRWRRVDKKPPPLGSLVDLWTKAPEWEAYHFGKVTTSNSYVAGPCFNDGEKGLLVLDPSITKWRYAK